MNDREISALSDTELRTRVGTALGEVADVKGKMLALTQRAAGESWDGERYAREREPYRARMAELDAHVKALYGEMDRRERDGISTYPPGM